MADVKQISKKKKFVADGVFNAEVHEFLTRGLVAAGYGGLTIKNTVNRIIITVKVVNKQVALGKNGVKGNELEALIEKRFGFKKGHVVINFDTIKNKSLSASAQVEFLKSKLLQGAPVRSAAMFIIRSVMRFREVKGCEVIISGKLRQQRAKTMKYKQGYLISTGQPMKDFIDVAIRHVFFKQGIMGIKVKIMLPTDFTGKIGGVNKILPDKVVIKDPKDNKEEDYQAPNQNQYQGQNSNQYQGQNSNQYQNQNQYQGQAQGQGQNQYQEQNQYQPQNQPQGQPQNQPQGQPQAQPQE